MSKKKRTGKVRRLPTGAAMIKVDPKANALAQLKNPNISLADRVETFCEAMFPGVNLLETQKQYLAELAAQEATPNHCAEIAAPLLCSRSECYARAFPSEQLATMLGIPRSILPPQPPGDLPPIVTSRAYRAEIDFRERLEAARDRLAPTIAECMRKAVEKAMGAELKEREAYLNGVFNSEQMNTYTEPKEGEPEVSVASIAASVEQLRAAGIGVTFESENPWAPSRVRWYFPSTILPGQWMCMNPRLSQREAGYISTRASPYPRLPDKHGPHYGAEMNPCGEVPQGDPTESAPGTSPHELMSALGDVASSVVTGARRR